MVSTADDDELQLAEVIGLADFGDGGDTRAIADRPALLKLVPESVAGVDEPPSARAAHLLDSMRVVVRAASEAVARQPNDLRARHIMAIGVLIGVTAELPAGINYGSLENKPGKGRNKSYRAEMAGCWLSPRISTPRRVSSKIPDYWPTFRTALIDELDRRGDQPRAAPQAPGGSLVTGTHSAEATVPEEYVAPRRKHLILGGIGTVAVVCMSVAASILILDDGRQEPHTTGSGGSGVMARGAARQVASPLSAVPTYPRPVVCSAPDGFVLPGGSDRLPPSPLDPENDVKWNPALYTSGAVPISGSFFTILFQAHSSDAVAITGIDFHVEGRGTPVTGTKVVSGCGDMVPTRFGIVDLNQNPPTVKYRFDRRTVANFPGADRAMGFPYAVTSTRQEYFTYIVNAVRSSVSWTVSIDWVSHGEHGTIWLGSNGKPFRTTTTENAKDTCTASMNNPRYLCD